MRDGSTLRTPTDILRSLGFFSAAICSTYCKYRTKARSRRHPSNCPRLRAADGAGGEESRGMVSATDFCFCQRAQRKIISALDSAALRLNDFFYSHFCFDRETEKRDIGLSQIIKVLRCTKKVALRSGNHEGYWFLLETSQILISSFPLAVQRVPNGSDGRCLPGSIPLRVSQRGGGREGDRWSEAVFCFSPPSSPFFQRQSLSTDFLLLLLLSHVRTDSNRTLHLGKKKSTFLVPVHLLGRQSKCGVTIRRGGDVPDAMKTVMFHLGGFFWMLMVMVLVVIFQSFAAGDVDCTLSIGAGKTTSASSQFV